MNDDFVPLFYLYTYLYCNKEKIIGEQSKLLNDYALTVHKTTEKFTY